MATPEPSHASFADYGISTDAGIGSDCNIPGNGRSRMDSDVGTGRNEKDFERTGESKIWVFSPKAGDSDGRYLIPPELWRKHVCF